MPVRVLINGLHSKSGGGVTYLRNMLPLLAADPRLEVHLALHAGQEALYQPVDPRLRLHLFDFRTGFLRLLLWEQTVLPRVARALGAEVVYSPANYGPLMAPNAVLLLSNAVAVGKSERRWGKRLYWVALSVMTFLSLLTCRRAMAVSGYARDALAHGWGGRRRGEVAVVHHGVAPLFAPDPQVEREPFLLAVSDIYVQKNLHSLLRAFAPVRARHPALRLVVAGAKLDQDYYDGALALVAELGLADAVRFTGRLPAEELRALYRRCLLFVFPSTAETFGMPLVEAMACGAPVASSNATAMPEIVGDAALLFDPRDEAAITDALCRLIDSPGLRADLSRAALRRAAAFSWQRAADATAAILCQAAGRR